MSYDYRIRLKTELESMPVMRLSLVFCKSTTEFSGKTQTITTCMIRPDDTMENYFGSTIYNPNDTFDLAVGYRFAAKRAFANYILGIAKQYDIYIYPKSLFLKLYPQFRKKLYECGATQ